VSNPLASIGHATLLFLASIGRLAYFAGMTVSHVVRRPFYVKILLQQIMSVGYYSLPVVGLTAVFTGMVLALQAYTGFSQFGAQTAVARLVALSMTRELGPVLAGLMVAGRVGAAIAAEIGTMSVTDQIDALSTLSTNPYKYLVVPRVIAGLVTLPLLVVVADIIGVFGGYMVATYKFGFDPVGYLHQSIDILKVADIDSGLIKAAVFGVIVTLVGCFHGYHSRGGAQGVGVATTNAVVTASILILLSDYVLTEMLFRA
jgi:phospholipid/cholesterol/gamma-HCH transport system permease protein